MDTPPVINQSPPSGHSERRRFSRIAFDAETLLAQGTQQWPCQLLDISLKGLLIQEPESCTLDDSQPLQVTISLSEEIQIQLEAVLSWHKDGQMGLAIQRLDTESISHLRRLIELNLGDTEAADRELLALITPD